MGLPAAPLTILIFSDHVRTVQKDFKKTLNEALNVPPVKNVNGCYGFHPNSLRYQIYFLILIGV